MRLSTVITKIQELLDDPNSNVWTAKELTSYINDQVFSLIRKMTEIDEGYHNYQFDLLQADARQQAQSVWEYTLPRWVMKISEVRIKQTSATTTEGPAVGPITKYDKGPGYMMYGLHTLRLQGFANEQDLTLVVAKRPARLTKGTLATQTGSPAMTTTQLRLDVDTSADAVNYPHETETDFYANAIVEMTGVNSTSHKVGGQIVRCTASAHLETQSSTLHTVLTTEPAWAVQPATSDTYEMHVEIPDEHIRLLVLLVARAAFTKQGNSDEIRALRDELTEQWSSFISHIRPRQLQEPKRIRSSLSLKTPRRDNDSADWYWG